MSYVDDLDHLIYFSEEPVDVDATRRMLGCAESDSPPTICAGFDFPTLPLVQRREVAAWAERSADVKVPGFNRRRVVAAMPHVVYWFGWRDREIPFDAAEIGRRLVRVAESAKRAKLPTPAVGISHAISDWADLRRALTRATVGFRLATRERRSFGTSEEVERFLAAPRPAPRSTAALVAAAARGDRKFIEIEAPQVAESFSAAYVSPLATLRTRLFSTLLQCGEAVQAAGTTEHVVTRWADHRLRRLWQVYSLPLLETTFVECLVELADLAAGAARGNLPRIAAAAKSLLTATWNENYPAGYLAREVGVSVGQLSRVFKQALGCSIPAFRNRLRIERAAEMLRSTDKSVTTVALECGFTNLTHFHRMFVRAHGRSPTEFRRVGDRESGR